MTVPDRLAYTKGEKIAEVCSVISAVLSAVVQMFLSGFAGGVITGIVTLLFCGIFSIAGVWPQHTNVIGENAAEEDFRKIRRNCIAVKIFMAVFLLAVSFIL